MSFLIREGKVGDMVSVLELIHELAAIKKKEDKVTITIYDLIRDGFSVNWLFKTYVAETEGKVVGFAMYYKSYSTNGRSLILEEIFVSKNYKKAGIGLSLFAKVLDFAKKNDINRLEWGVLTHYENLIKLYQRVGARVLWDTSIFTMNQKVIDKVLESKSNISSLTSFAKIAIRKGRKKDMPSVLELIKELAIYKKSSCDINAKDLLKDGFSKRPFFYTIVLEIDDKIVGVLLFYHSYSIFKGKSLILEDIHVKKEYRKFGFGEVLNYKFFEYAKKHGKKRISQAIYDFDDAAIDRCMAFKAKKVENMRLIQMSSDALNSF